MLVEVVVESPGRTEKRILDAVDGVVTVGRAPNCTLPLESGLVSRAHLTVDVTGSRMRVTDSSTNGTLVGEVYVRGSSADLAFGAPIVVGDYMLWFSPVRDGVSPASSAHRQDDTEGSPGRASSGERTGAEVILQPTVSPPAPLPPDRGPSALDAGLRNSAREAEGAATRIANGAFEETLRHFFRPVCLYLDDPSVSEIMINGPDQIYVERRGVRERVPAKFANQEALIAALRNLSQHVGKQVDEAHPILEGLLPDGSRVVALMPPIAPDGPHVAIHRSFCEALTVERLVQSGSLTGIAAAALQAMVIAKLNIVIAGATSSGKTSMLSALAGFIPDDERIVVVEESREVRCPKPHVVHLEARPIDPLAMGAVTIRDLFRVTLRMRPDRVVVGEIRGGEALDIVQALTGGRCGYMGTLHAARPRDALTPLETMCMMSDIEVPLHALRHQIGSGVQVVVQVARLQDGSRKVTHLTEVRGFDPERQRYALADLFAREYRGLDERNQVVSELVPTGVLSAFRGQLCEGGVDLPGPLLEAARQRRDLGGPPDVPS